MSKFKSSKSSKTFLEDAFPPLTPSENVARKTFATRIGHVKGRVLRNERLRGELLKFALDNCVRDDVVAEKLRRGEELTVYEKHLVMDVWALHARLAGP